MAMNDDDKWASQLLDEMLEKLAKVDRIIAPHTEKTKNNRQNISEAITNVITKDTSSQEPKTHGNQTSSSAFKNEEGADISYQPGEVTDVKYEDFDERFKDKLHFQEDQDSSKDLQKDRACDKVPGEDHKSSGEQTISHHEQAETVRKSNKTDIESENKDSLPANSVLDDDVIITYDSWELKKDNIPDNSLLDDSVVLIYDSWELENKDLLDDKSEDIFGKNLLQTDRECFQHREDNHINIIDEKNSGVLSNNFEELLIRNTEHIKEKDHRIVFSNRHDEDKKEIQQHGSHIESLYEHIDKKFIKEEREFCRYAERGNSTEFCSGIKTENMPEKLDTEKYEKNGNVKIKIELQGDGCNIEIENEELEKQGDIINQAGDDIDGETILLDRNSRDAFKEGEENYEDIGSNIKIENRKHFDLKNLKKITDLAPLIETVAFCFSMDSITDIDLVSHPKINSRIPSNKIYDVSPRIDVSDDPVIAERYLKVISVYRNSCRAFEDLFLSPFAMFIAESIDIITFVFFLSVSVFYMFYKSLNIKFNCFRNNLRDILKKENQREVSTISKAYNFLTSDLKNEIEINYESDETDSMSSFSSHEEERETVENKNEINVAPDKVNVLNYVCENAKQTLEDFYEKGSDFFENLRNEHATAVIKSPEDIFIDIILKDSGIQSSEEDQMKVDDVNICSTDLDQNIVKSSDVICQQCEKNSSKFIAFSNEAQDISYDISGSICSSNVAAEDHNESHLMEFPILFDKSRANNFNSTEIDQSIFDTRSRRAYKTLSPSEINIFDGLRSSCISPGSIYSNGLRNSSPSVNATSFPSISSINIRSRSCSSSISSFNMEKADPSFQEGSFYIDPIRMGQDSDIIRMSKENIADSIKNETQSGELFFHTEPKNSGKTMGSIQQGEPHDKDTEDSNSLERLESSSLNAGSTSKFSDVSGRISVIEAEEEQTSYNYCENSVMYENPESLSYSASTDNTYNEICFVDSDETEVSDARILKKKRSRILSRRMSGIFNNLRGVNLMQCVRSSSKRQKKYKKQTNGPDA